MKTKLLATLLCVAALLASTASTFAADEKATPKGTTNKTAERTTVRCWDCGKNHATGLCKAILIPKNSEKTAAKPTPKTPATGTPDAQGRIWFSCPTCGELTQSLSKHKCKSSPK